MEKTLFHTKLDSVRVELMLSWEDIAERFEVKEIRRCFYRQGKITEATNTASVERAANVFGLVPLVFYRVLDRGLEDLGIEPFDVRGVENYIGRVFQKHRIGLGLTHQGVADGVSIGRSTYSEYESGVRRPRVHILEKLCKELRLHPVYLLQEVRSELG